MDDIIIDNEQFKVCMVKKSKHYYKEVGFWGGIVVAAIVACIVVINIVAYLSNVIHIDNMTAVLIFLMYAASFLGITYALTSGSSHFITEFIRNFILLHGLVIVFVGTVIVTLVCMIAIPIEVAIILGKVMFDVTGSVDVAFFGGIAVFVIMMPVNIAAFQCFKIEAYMDKCLATSIGWFHVNGDGK